MLRRAADALAVTEPDAMAAYLAHTKAHKCNANGCDTAWRLHHQWQQAAERQTAPPRRQPRVRVLR